MILQKYTEMNELFEYAPVSDKEFFPLRRKDQNWAKLYGLDLTGCNVRNRRKNNYAGESACVIEELSDINRWNSGYWAAVLISPRHAVVCAHYWRVVPSQQNNLRFWGKSGVEYNPTVKSTRDIGLDRLIIEFEDELPTDDVKIYKIVDFRWIPSGTKLWIHDNQGRILYKIHDVIKQWKYPEFNFEQIWHPDPVLGDICSVFSGDSGSPVFMTDPVTNETYFVGNMAGGYQYYEDRQMEQELKQLDSRIKFVRPSDFRGDINRDGKVDSADLAHILANHGKHGYVAGDVNWDGKIDGKDVGELLGDWGELQPNVLWYEDWYGSDGLTQEPGSTSDKQTPGGVVVQTNVTNTETGEETNKAVINYFSYRKK